MRLLDELAGPLTLGTLLKTIRETDGVKGEEGCTQTAFAKKVGISRQNLCDIEKGRTSVSAKKAAKFAKRLGYHPAQFVQLALQAQLDAAKIKMTVHLKAA